MIKLIIPKQLGSKNSLSQDYLALWNSKPQSIRSLFQWFRKKASIEYNFAHHAYQCDLKQCSQFFSTHQCWNKSSPSSKPHGDLNKLPNLCFGACLDALWSHFALKINFAQLCIFVFWKTLLTIFTFMEYWFVIKHFFICHYFPWFR